MASCGQSGAAAEAAPLAGRYEGRQSLDLNDAMAESQDTVGTSDAEPDGFWYMLMLCLPAGLALGARWLLDGPELSSEVRASASSAQLLGLFAPICAAILLYEWFARPPAGLWRNLVVVAAALPTAYFLWRALLWLQFLTGAGGYTG